MRSAAPTLAPLFRSDHQLNLLASLFLYRGEWTIGELAEHAGVPLSTASREVHRLVDAGLASLKPKGQLRLVTANQDLPWVDPLVELLDQTVGPIHHLRGLLDESEWAAIDEAYVFGSWARRYHGESGPQPNDLDVVLIATTSLPANKILRFQRQLQDRIHMGVDAFAVTPAEWASPKGHEALADIKDNPTVRVTRMSAASEDSS